MINKCKTKKVNIIINKGIKNVKQNQIKLARIKNRI